MKLKLFALISILFLVSCGRSGSTDIDPTVGKIKPLKIEMSFTADHPISFGRAFANKSQALFVNGKKMTNLQMLENLSDEYLTYKEVVTTSEETVFSYSFTSNIETPKTIINYNIKVYLGDKLYKQITNTVTLGKDSFFDLETITNVPSRLDIQQ